MVMAPIQHVEKVSCLKNPHRFLTIEPVIFLYISGFLLQIPVLQQYLYERAAEDVGISGGINETIVCNADNQTETQSNTQKNIQRTASTYILVVSLSSLLPAIFTASLLGSWSDKGGRKLAMLLPSIGAMLEIVSILLVMYAKLPLYIICIGAGVAGLTGHYPAIVLGVLSYIIDTTPDERKVSFRLGIVEAAAFLSGVVGQLLSGVWIEKLGYESPFWVMLGLHLINSLYITFLLPESLPIASRQKSRLFSCSNYASMYNVFIQPRSGGRWRLCLLLVTFFFMMMVMNMVIVIFVLFAKGYPLCWGTKEIGYFLGSYLFSKAFGAVVGLKFFGALLKFSNYTMALIGFIFFMGHFLQLGTATTLVQVFAVDVVAALSAMSPPCMRAEISKTVTKNEQGAIFSVVSCMETACSFLSNLIFTPLYAFSLDFNFKYSHGSVFFLAAIIAFIPFSLTSFLGTRENTVINYEPVDEEMHDDDKQVNTPVS